MHSISARHVYFIIPVAIRATSFGLHPEGRRSELSNESNTWESSTIHILRKILLTKCTGFLNP